MALSKSVLSAAMREKFLSGMTGTGFHAVDGPDLTSFCDAIADAVVTHITGSAVVMPTALLAPPGTAGGPVTGTGTIT